MDNLFAFVVHPLPTFDRKDRNAKYSTHIQRSFICKQITKEAQGIGMYDGVPTELRSATKLCTLTVMEKSQRKEK